MKYLKTYEYLNDESKEDLEDLSETISFLMGYLEDKDKFDLPDMLKIINELKNMSWDEIEEYRESSFTNYPRTLEDEFVIRIIDRYCSNVDLND